MSTLYIRVKTGFFTHKKTAKLRLSIGDCAFWVPPRIWAYCAENQPDGDLSDYSAELLASLIGYSGNAQALLEALRDSGFIEKGGGLHHWEEHNGYHKSYSERAKLAANARWEKVRERVKKKEAKKNSTDSGNRKQESGHKHCSSDAPSIGVVQEDIIYAAYPKKAGRPKALVSIKKAIEEFGFEFVLAKTTAYAEVRKSADPQFTPMPATWFNQQRFNDESSTWTNSNTGKHLSPSMQAALDKTELERIEKKISEIKNSVETHQDLSPQDREKLKPLTARRGELKKALGWTV